jgi:hypothetical protein
MDEIQNPHVTHKRLQLREMTCGKEKMRKLVVLSITVTVNQHMMSEHFLHQRQVIF